MVAVAAEPVPPPRQLMETQRFKEAKEQLEIAIRSGDASTENWLMLGTACAALGSNSAAKQAYSEALKLEPNNPAVLYNLAILALREQKWDEAIDHLHALVQERPGDLEARFALAHALAKSGKPEDALRNIDETLQAQPSPETYLRAAALFEANGLLNESEARLDTAVAKWPDRHDLKLALSQVASRLNHDVRVIAMLGSAQTPLDPVASELLGTSLFRLGRFAEAAPVLQTTVSSINGPSLPHDFDMLIQSYAALGKLEAATSAAEESERKVGHRESSLIALANILQLEKRDPEAISLLEQQRAQFSKSGRYLFTLALSYHNVGSESRAAQILNTVVQVAPNLHQARYLAGMCAASQGDFEGAITQLRAGVSLAPARFLYHFELGFVLSKARRKEDAEKSLLRSIELNPRHAPARYELAKIFSDSGRSEAAIDQLQKSLELNPEDENALYLASKVYTKLGRRAEAGSARQEFQRLQQLRLEQQRDQREVAAAAKLQ
jgi:tetratricopeptide (TPR) repeat protein